MSIKPGELQNAPISAATWDKANKNRSRADLVSLGLIKVDANIVYSLVEQDASAEDALRHAALKAPMLQATREILISNPNATGVEIGDEVGKIFRRNYNAQSSKLRVGNALRRWAIWLEPHLVPAGTGSTARLRVSAQSGKTHIGAPSLATPENLERMQKALDQGMKPDDVAKMIGISRQAFYNWKKKGLIQGRKWRKIKSDKTRPEDPS